MKAQYRTPGQFCWFEVMTHDTSKGRKFFTELFGWKLEDDPNSNNTYALIKVKDAQIGGFYDLKHSDMPKETPAHIGLHVATENIDKTTKAVTAAGGKIYKQPFDVMDYGRMAVCADPAGAVFCTWEAKKHKGTNVDPMLNGAPSWFELLTNNIDAAAPFYNKVFGWNPKVKKMQGFDYTEFYSGSNTTMPVAGMMQITPDMGKLPPHWGVYFTVADCDQTFEKALKLGARKAWDTMNIDGVGRMVGLTSPDNVYFSIVAYKS